MQGLSPRAISNAVFNRSRRILGEHRAMHDHDMRRTCAYNLRQSSVDLDVIQRQLRHQSYDTTARYVGARQNLANGVLSNHINIMVPQINAV
jgi:integrase